MASDNFTKLEVLVRSLYESKDPNRDEWADWMYPNHVLWVADKAEVLARRFNVDPSLCRVAALLHDISDAKIARIDNDSERLSDEMSRELLKKAGFEPKTIALLVDDAIKFHSCKNGEMPSSNVGKVLATADALAHFQTDFYLHAFSFKSFADYEKNRRWAAEKIIRDFNNKILYDEIREEVRPQYETFKILFGVKQ